MTANVTQHLGTLMDGLRQQLQHVDLTDLKTGLLTLLSAFIGYGLLHSVWKKKQIKQKLRGKYEKCQQSIADLKERISKIRLPAAPKRNKILQMSLVELQTGLRSGKVTAKDALAAYQYKALEVNDQLNCVVEPVYEAEQIAAECDKKKDKTGLLHGIPISVKENYYIKGYDSTGGMKCLIDRPAAEDGVLIKILKRHGAVPFVRTNIPQSMMTYECSNPIYGQTVNPHDESRGPGGSSGGEGALIGAGGSILGFGTDIGGSIRIPCHMCGVCGLKPTAGRITLKGTEELICGQELVVATAGPISQEVDGLVLGMRALLSPYAFELDPLTPPLPFRTDIYESREPLRIGYYTFDGYLPVVPACERAVLEAKVALEQRGHKLVPFQVPRVKDMFGRLFLPIAFGDGGKGFLDMMKNDQVDPSLWETIMYYRLPTFLQNISTHLITLIARDSFPSTCARAMRGVKSVPEWWKFAEELQSYKDEFLGAWKEAGLDAVICPGFAYPAVPSGCVTYVLGGVTYTTLYNTINYPAGSVPVTEVTEEDERKMEEYPSKTGYEKGVRKYFSSGTLGLPVNVQCVSLPYQEEITLRVMKELETEFKQ